MKESRIIEIAHLIEYLLKENDRTKKIDAIRWEMLYNHITFEEAIDLVIEYC